MLILFQTTSEHESGTHHPTKTVRSSSYSPSCEKTRFHTINWVNYNCLCRRWSPLRESKKKKERDVQEMEMAAAPVEAREMDLRGGGGGSLLVRSLRVFVGSDCVLVCVVCVCWKEGGGEMLECECACKHNGIIYTSTSMHAQTQTHTNAYASTCTHAQIQSHTNTYTCAHRHTHTNTHAKTRTHTHTLTLSLAHALSVSLPPPYVLSLRHV